MATALTVSFPAEAGEPYGVAWPVGPTSSYPSIMRLADLGGQGAAAQRCEVSTAVPYPGRLIPAGHWSREKQCAVGRRAQEERSHMAALSVR